jgi:hypothetical protein
VAAQLVASQEGLSSVSKYKIPGPRNNCASARRLNHPVLGENIDLLHILFLMSFFFL